MSAQPFSYPPDLASYADPVRHTVRLTFGVQQLRSTASVCVQSTGAQGADVIDRAISQVMDLLMHQIPRSAEGDLARRPCLRLVGTDVDGDAAEVISEPDDEQTDAEWLRSMLLAAEIVAVEPA